MMEFMSEVLMDAERNRQDALWGVQDHAPPVWLAIVTEEYGEVRSALHLVGLNNTALTDDLAQFGMALGAFAKAICDWQFDAQPLADLVTSAVRLRDVAQGVVARGIVVGHDIRYADTAGAHTVARRQRRSWFFELVQMAAVAAAIVESLERQIAAKTKNSPSTP